MQARRCQGCAAPLPGNPTKDAVRCPFCGLLHDAEAAAGPSVQVHRIEINGAGRGSARMPRWVLALIAVIAAATLGPLLAGVYVAWRAGSAVMSANRVGAPSTRALTTAALKDLAPGYHPIQVAPPAGGYGAVDAVAALPWALAIAQAWQDDARLERIDVVRMRPDGTVNVADDAEAALTYRFTSPGAVKALRDQAQLRASAKAVVAFWVRVRSGAPQVFADEQSGRAGDDEAAAPHPDALGMVQLAQRPPVQALRADLPYLNGYLIHLAREGWVWYFSSLAGDAMPRVRARDGAVWPYRPARP